VRRGLAVPSLARVAGLVLGAAAVAGAVACSDGTTPNCPDTDSGCSYVPVQTGPVVEGGAADAAPPGETGEPDAAE
jgi:hypothetical protein